MAAAPATPPASTSVEILKQELQTEEQSSQPGGFSGFAAKLTERFNLKRSKGKLTSLSLYQLALEAQEFDTACKQRIQAVDKKMEPIVKSAFETHRRLTALRDEMKAGAVQGRNVAGVIKGEYDRIRNAEIAAENARLKAVAEAAEKAKRDEAAAEAKRQADAAAAQEAAALILAEQAAAAGDADAEEAAQEEAEQAAATAAIANATAAPSIYSMSCQEESRPSPTHRTRGCCAFTGSLTHCVSASPKPGANPPGLS
jgi:hypothetical protein